MLSRSTEEEEQQMTRIHSAFPKRLLLLSICSMFIGMSISWGADKDESDVAKRIDASAKVLNEIMATPDKAIPDKVMRDAKCIAVIPSMVKIAVGFGGNHGKGVATCRTASGWSAPLPSPSPAEAGVCNWVVRRSTWS